MNKLEFLSELIKAQEALERAAHRFEQFCEEEASGLRKDDTDQVNWLTRNIRRNAKRIDACTDKFEKILQVKNGQQ